MHGYAVLIGLMFHTSIRAETFLDGACFPAAFEQIVKDGLPEASSSVSLKTPIYGRVQAVSDSTR